LTWRQARPVPLRCLGRREGHSIAGEELAPGDHLVAVLSEYFTFQELGTFLKILIENNFSIQLAERCRNTLHF
jgi:hypothetical protein